MNNVEASATKEAPLAVQACASFGVAGCGSGVDEVPESLLAEDHYGRLGWAESSPCMTVFPNNHSTPLQHLRKHLNNKMGET